MSNDIRGTPVSCSNQAALDLYETALTQYQSYFGDAVATIQQALQAQPDFILGHIFKAGVLMTFSEQRFAKFAQESVNRAEELFDKANPREQLLIRAMRQLVDGDWYQASSTLDKVLVHFPRDAFAIQTAHLFDFYQGDALNLRNRVMRVLPNWSPSVPGYSFILGMYAFGLEECNQYRDAELCAKRALEIEPRDAWSVHAGIHVYEMRGQVEEGIAWLESRERDWAPDNGFAFHNWWHLALLYLDRGDFARVLQLFDERILPQPTDLSLTLLDATSLLWRLHLLGLDVGDRAERVAAAWHQKLDEERDFLAFNDIHALMAFILADQKQGIARVLDDFEAWTSRSVTTTNGRMIHQVGMPLAKAFLAFGEQRWREAMEGLMAVRDRAFQFGGSHAQRDVLTLTLIQAALRLGDKAVARHYLAERNVSRPGSALGWRLHAQTLSH
ncbi:tetratricopeptide repeat protein [Oligoflexus tunisiensis]|uniref:tetratricopeptide repeat protein n=1 Tax=Oligoflexus tunisiensis TaxID=708132 RepID=UPI000AFA28E6|nr:tetratricopeptide repeat protein [Oligoflexus tunisiensis]